MVQQTALQELLQWVRATLPMDLDTPMMIEEKIESLLLKEKMQHGNTWDKAIDQYEARGRVISRAWVDFDDYYNETYK